MPNTQAELLVVDSFPCRGGGTAVLLRFWLVFLDLPTLQRMGSGLASSPPQIPQADAPGKERWTKQWNSYIIPKGQRPALTSDLDLDQKQILNLNRWIGLAPEKAISWEEELILPPLLGSYKEFGNRYQNLHWGPKDCDALWASCEEWYLK